MGKTDFSIAKEKDEQTMKKKQLIKKIIIWTILVSMVLPVVMYLI